MGWWTQGYRKISIENKTLKKKPASKYKQVPKEACWIVYGNDVDEQDWIYTYHKYEVPLAKEWRDKIEIFYGTSKQEYFRGYILANYYSIPLAKKLLKAFKGLPVFINMGMNLYYSILIK